MTQHDDFFQLSFIFMNPSISSTYDRIPSQYRLIRLLGIGATGEVLEAEREGMRVALKILHNNFHPSASLEREYRFLADLSHRNIVRIHRINLQDHRLQFIEMEMINGKNLTQFANESGGFLSWNALKPIAMQLCEALDHAHSRGVIHRDIKPSNLLIDETNTVKLVDFGCAYLSELLQTDITRTADIVPSGTLAYMSPNQINGERPQTSDDIYSVGATLHALLVSAPPFAHGRLVHHILNVKPPLISLHQRKLMVKNPVPSDIMLAIRACLAKNAAMRPRSVAALYEIFDKESYAPITRRRVIISLMGCGLCCAFGSAIHHKFDQQNDLIEPGFVAIFDGESLAGWQGNHDIWKVKDGEIIARIDAPRMPDASNWRKEFLDWVGQTPNNFELRLQVRLNLPVFDAGNLGVRYRISTEPKTVSYDLDFEPIWKYNCGLRELGGRDMMARPAQITHYRGGKGENESNLIGHLASEETLKEAYIANSWNELTVRAEGNRLIHVLNGVTIVDCTDEDPEYARYQGGIGLKILLYYGPWVEARFRRIRIREIESKAPQQ